MIDRGNHNIQVQYEKGETDMVDLTALAIAAFDRAPRGNDVDNQFDPLKKLTPEDIAELDLIKFTPCGDGMMRDLVMDGDIFGRDCNLYVTQIDNDGTFAVTMNVDVYDGCVEDLLLRAKEILPELIGQNSLPVVPPSAANLQ